MCLALASDLWTAQNAAVSKLCDLAIRFVSWVQKGLHSPLEHFLGDSTFTMFRLYLSNGRTNRRIYNG